MLFYLELFYGHFYDNDANYKDFFISINSFVFWAEEAAYLLQQIQSNNKFSVEREARTSWYLPAYWINR